MDSAVWQHWGWIDILTHCGMILMEVNIMSGNTMKVAAQSEAKFIVKAFEMGWEVAKPFHHSQGYDFVIRRDGKEWETVQVKTAYNSTRGRQKKLARAVSLRRCNEKGSRPYKEGEYDLLFTVDDDKYLLIPWSEISHIKSQILVDGPKYEGFLV